LTDVSDPRTSVDNFSEVKSLDQWICWSYKKDKGQKPKKPPTHPTGGYDISPLDPSNWMAYYEAVLLSESSSFLEGIGFVLTENDDLCFLDIDERIDEETGEIPAWISRLLDKLDSYAYLTPNHGVRIVVRGTLEDAGGNYAYTDPDTNEEHVFELYDKDRYLTFTDHVVHDAPIKESQDFLNSLRKARKHPPKKSTKRNSTRIIQALPEVDLPEDLEEGRKKLKRLFMKYGLSPHPIMEGSRKNTLLSYFRKIARNENMKIYEEPHLHPAHDDMWELINLANETMLYDENGDLAPLDYEEIEEIYIVVTKDLPNLAYRPAWCVRKRLDELLRFLQLIRVRTRKDSMWKVLKALEEHGRKHGRDVVTTDHEVRVDIGWVALGKQARIGSKKTLSKALRDLRITGMVSRGRDKGDKTGHFVIDLEKVMRLPVWGIHEEIEDIDEEGGYAEVNKGEKKHLHHISFLQHKGVSRDTIEGLLEDKGFLDALVHTTWYRYVGPSTIRYLLAVCHLGGEATNSEVAKLVGVKPTSTSRPLKRLKKEGLLTQDKPRDPYRVSENVAEDLYRVRLGKGDFDRDDRAWRDAQKERRYHAYKRHLKDVIVRLIQEENMSSREALFKAVEEVPLPRGIGDDYELLKRQESALRWAEWEMMKKTERGEDWTL
jgi:DNA-binding transcriptional ArsR family regulator